MNNLTDTLDALRNTLELEILLRAAAGVEFANGNTNGPMRQAHDVAVANAVAGARSLVDIAGKKP